MIEIRVDDKKLKQLERELRDFGASALPQVISRGLNRTAEYARTQSSRFISKRTGIKVGDVRRRIFLDRASFQNWRAAIIVSRKRLSLRYLAPSRTSGGYLSVKHQGGRILIRHAFEAMKGWFIRLPAAGGYKMTLGVEHAAQIDEMKKVGRLPIGKIRGPILAQIFVNAQDEVNRIYAESMNLLEKNIHDQVHLILKRRLPA